MSPAAFLFSFKNLPNSVGSIKTAPLLFKQINLFVYIIHQNWSFVNRAHNNSLFLLDFFVLESDSPRGETPVQLSLLLYLNNEYLLFHTGFKGSLDCFIVIEEYTPTTADLTKFDRYAMIIMEGIPPHIS